MADNNINCSIKNQNTVNIRLIMYTRVYLGFHCSRLSLFRSPMDSEYFEISVHRYIWFAELKKNKSNNHISQMNM